jgi:AraC-like DNA-binding protein
MLHFAYYRVESLSEHAVMIAYQSDETFARALRVLVTCSPESYFRAEDLENLFEDETLMVDPEEA